MLSLPLLPYKVFPKAPPPKLSFPALPTRQLKLKLVEMLSFPVPALMNWFGAVPIRVSPVFEPVIVLLKVAIRVE